MSDRIARQDPDRLLLRQLLACYVVLDYFNNWTNDRGKLPAVQYNNYSNFNKDTTIIPMIILFNFKNDTISIEINAHFDGENLVIEGYDIGKKVKEVWGDSDYEYSTTVPENEVKKLYTLFHVPEGKKENLLQAIARRYNTNTCYSEFCKFLDENGIYSEGFSWA